MTVGTKSVLFGAHCFLYHGLAVAVAWWKLYRWSPAFDGCRWPAILDPRAWLVFFVHDLGYIGLPDMDGPTTGERHPEIPAILVSVLFDRRRPKETLGDVWRQLKAARDGDGDARRGLTLLEMCGPWGRFSLLHSRHYAKAAELQPSRLCCADKLALKFTPWWLYLPGVILSGEIREYMAEAEARGQAVGISTASRREWFETMREYCARWAYEHADGRVDTWTGNRQAGGLDTPEGLR